MQFNLKRITAMVATSTLVFIGFGALSSPAQALDACPYPVENQAANDHPLATIRLVSPVLTDENSVHRTDFEEEFTILCDWFGVGTHFNQVYVPFGMTTNLTYQATDPKGAPLAFTQLKLRANKGYSSSNAHIYVNGTSIRPNTGGVSDGGIIKATTDVNGFVSFVIKSPTDCEEYGGKLPAKPAHLNSDTPHDSTMSANEDCYTQVIPQIISETTIHTEKTDTVDFVELHYYDPLPRVSTSPVLANVPVPVPTVVPAQTPSISGGKVTLTTGVAHGLSVGDFVTIDNVSPSGYRGTYQVTAVPSSTSFSYANSTTGNITTAGTVVLSPGNGSVATLTTSIAHGLSVGDFVTIENVAPSGYTGTYQVTAVPSSTSFSYANSTTGNITTAGTLKRSPGNGTIVTLNTSSAHGFRVGQSVAVEGVEPAGYNGTRTITAVTPNTFSFMDSTTGAISTAGHAILVGIDRVTGEDPVTEAQLALAVPYFDDSNSIISGTTIQAYSKIGSKQTVVVQATKRDGSWARNALVKLRINLGNSGANAKVSAGIYGDSYRGFNSPAYTVNSLSTSASDTTKTADDQLVLTGKTDAFGSVVFALNNSDTSGETAPVSLTSPVPTGAEAKYSRVTATIEGVSSNDPILEVHFFNPAAVLPTVITATATGRVIKVTLKNAKGKTSTITITGKAKVTLTPTSATQVLNYTVTKGVKKVVVVSNGKTLTKTFTIK